jgi:hypothetical protein
MVGHVSTDCKKLQGWGCLQWRNVHTVFVKGIWLQNLNEERAHTHTSTHPPTIIIKANYFFSQEEVRWAVHVARMGEERNAYRMLVGKPEGNH